MGRFISGRTPMGRSGGSCTGRRGRWVVGREQRSRESRLPSSTGGVRMRKQWFSALSLAAAAAFTVPLAAQQPAPAPPPPAPPAATTKEGVSAKPVHLKDLRGKTVVLAFFYQARTKG